MAASLGTLRVDLIADIARFSRGMTRAEQIANRRSRAIRTAIRSIGGAFAGISIGAAFGKTVSAFSEYEKNLVAVGKTANLSGKELQDFGNQVRDLGEKVPISNSSLLQLSATAAQLGIQGTDNLLAFTETMGRLELATDVAGSEGAASIARLLNVTKTAITDVDKFGNVLVELGNNSAATENEILGVATRVAQASAQFGVSANEALAYGAAFKSVGQQAESVGTVIGKTFRVISMATAQGGEDLQRIAQIAGMTSEEFKKLFSQSASQAVNAFIVGLGNLSGGANEVASSLEDLGLSGERPAAILGSIANASENLTDSFSTMNRGVKENNALLIESAKSADTFSAQMTFLGNAADRAAANIGKMIVPGLISAMQSLGNALKVVADNTVYLKDAAVIVAAVISGKLLVAIAASNVALAATAIATGNVNLALLVMQARMAIATAATWAFNAALAVNPLVLIAGAIAAAGAALLIYKNHANDAAAASVKYGESLKNIDQYGKAFTESTYAAVKALAEENKQLAENERAALKAAIAQKQLIISRGPGFGEQYKLLSGQMSVLENKLAIAETASRKATLEIERLGKESAKAAAAVNKAGDAGNNAAAGVGAVGDAAKDAADKLQEMADALNEEFKDPTEKLFDKLQQYQELLDLNLITQEKWLAAVRKAEQQAGVVDPSIAAGQRVQEAADRADPKRELGREIEQLRADIVYRTDPESKRLAIKELGEMMDKFNSVSDASKDAADKSSEFWNEAARRMENAMADQFFNIMQGNFDNMGKQWKATIDRMVSDMLASQLLDLVKSSFSAGAGGSGGFGFITDFFKAAGGPVSGGQPYMVGERGPELFVPQTSGVIHPNNQLNTGGITVNQIVNTPDINSFKHSGRQLAQDQARLLGSARAFA